MRSKKYGEYFMALKMITTSLSFLLLLGYDNAFSGSMGLENKGNDDRAFYVGIDMGVSDFQDKTSHTILPETHHLGGLGVVGGGFVGYDFRLMNTLMLGLEGFANATGLNTSIQHYYQTTGVQDNSEKISSRYNLGVRLLPGLQLNQEHEGHLIIGYSNASFKHLDNGTYGYLDTGFHQHGLQVGAGWKTNVLNRNTLLRLDVLYTRYASQNSTGLGLPGSGSPYQYYADRLNTLEADLSLIHKFN